MKTPVKKLLILAVTIGALFFQSVSHADLGEVYQRALQNIDKTAPALAADLSNYLSEPCSKRIGARECQFAVLFPTYQKLEQSLNDRLGTDWEVPNSWNELIVRSAYWNVSPFATSANAAKVQADLVRWLLVRRALSESLGDAVQYMNRLSPGQSHWANKTVLPMVQAYFGGVTMASRRFRFLRQVNCESDQTACHQFVERGLSTLKAAFNGRLNWAVRLQSRLRDTSSPLISDLQLALTKVQRLEDLYTNLIKLDSQSMIKLALGLTPDSKAEAAFNNYLNELRAQTFLSKRPSDTDRIAIWSDAVALNDLIATGQELNKITVISAADSHSDSDVLKDIAAVLGGLEQFLRQQGIDIEQINPQTIPHAPEVM